MKLSSQLTIRGFATSELEAGAATWLNEKEPYDEGIELYTQCVGHAVVS